MPLLNSECLFLASPVKRHQVDPPSTTLKHGIRIPYFRVAYPPIVQHWYSDVRHNWLS